MRPLIYKLLSMPLLIAVIGVGTVHAASSTPSANLFAVASSFEVRTKSLTTQVNFRPGYTVTTPVTIRLDFASPATQYKPLKQVYDPRNGNQFVYSDLPWGGRSRDMIITMTLSDDTSIYDWPIKRTLDPLFAVSVSPLEFRLLDDCDRLGKSDIKLVLLKPDTSRTVESFKMGKGGYRLTQQFYWYRPEASASEGLTLPDVVFGDNDFFTKFNTNYTPPQQALLTGAGASQPVQRIIKASAGGNCRAQINYTLTYALRQYTHL